MNFKVNVLQVEAYIKVTPMSEGFGKKVRAEAHLFVKHFKRDHKGRTDVEMSLMDLRSWGNDYFADKKRNNKRYYQPTYRNNLFSAFSKASHLAYDIKQIQLVSPWSELKAECRVAMMKSKQAEWHKVSFEAAWARFENYVNSINLKPDQFSVKAWIKFRVYMLNLSDLSPSSATTYMECLKAGFTGCGYDFDLGKKPIVVSPHVLNQFDLLSEFLTTKRPLTPRTELKRMYPGFDEKEIKKLSKDSFFIAAKTWKTNQSTLKVFLNFLGKTEADDLTKFINYENVKKYFLDSLKDESLSQESFKNRVYMFAKVVRASVCLPDSYLGCKTPIERYTISNSIKDLYIDYKDEFTKETKREKSAKKNLLSLPEVFMTAIPRLQNEVSAIRDETKRLNFSNFSEEKKKKKLLGLALRYRKVIERIIIIHFAMRPTDMFEEFCVDSHELVEELVSSQLYKTVYGSWLVNFNPSKTSLRDKRRGRKPLRIYFMFPPRWQHELEEYLECYRPLLSSLSPLVFPNSRETSRQLIDGKIEGARTGIRYYEIMKHSKWMLGRKYTQNDYRRILMSFLYACGLESNEALLLGHTINLNSMSSTARDQYLLLTDDQMHRRGERYYNVFYAEIDLSIAKIKASAQNLRGDSPRLNSKELRVTRDVTPNVMLIESKKSS